MDCSNKLKIYVVSFALLAFMEGAAMATTSVDNLAACLTENGIRNYTSSQNFDHLLEFSIQNLRFTGPNVFKPSLIVLPKSKQEVQQAVTCCRQEGFDIRVRCGGHSYEGTSCTAEAPFAIIDLMNLNSVKVDVHSKTAWVDGGATLGETYYAIAHATGGYGFSAGSCPTVGSGGHFSGGGFGFLSRKYGLAADNIVDAEVVDAKGALLDRKRMGEDLFWAIRGGGGGSWGVVVGWKIKLLEVPPTVTVFTVSRRGLEAVTELVYTWQTVAPNLEDDFYLSVFVGASLPEAPNQGISATFKGMYLGPKTEMLKSLSAQFPTLGIADEDCKQMSWINSMLFFSGLASERLDDVNSLRDRYLGDKNYFYAKSDYVRKPIPKFAIQAACRILEEEPQGYVIMDPYGAKMAEIPSDAIPFPHRAGNLFDIQYLVAWYDANANEGDYIGWLRKLYAFMAAYVSENPRAAYVNYMDLDLGTLSLVKEGSSPVETARKWGEKYFLGNFERLLRVKTKFDPDNVFRNLQSIPPDQLQPELWKSYSRKLQQGID